MRKLGILVSMLGILLLASPAFAQFIGLTFDEAGTQSLIDGRSDLIPNPDFFNFPSAIVWVIAFDIPELFGYEYNLSSSDATAFVAAPEVWPAEGSDFGTLPGDVRVGTGICFQAGSTQAGPDPAHIRLAKHTYTWQTPPAVDVTYCIGPSAASVQVSGATAPQYTECISNPVSTPFTIANQGTEGCVPVGCAGVIFEWEQDGVTPTNCTGVPVQSKSWGALKAGY